MRPSLGVTALRRARGVQRKAMTVQQQLKQAHLQHMEHCLYGIHLEALVAKHGRKAARNQESQTWLDRSLRAAKEETYSLLPWGMWKESSEAWERAERIVDEYVISNKEGHGEALALGIHFPTLAKRNSYRFSWWGRYWHSRVLVLEPSFPLLPSGTVGDLLSLYDERGALDVSCGMDTFFRRHSNVKALRKLRIDLLEDWQFVNILHALQLESARDPCR